MCAAPATTAKRAKETNAPSEKWRAAPDEQHLEQWIDCAYDLANRASWKTASRQEWMVIVTNKINKDRSAGSPRSSASLGTMHRQASAALTLARNYEALGDVVLGTIQEGLPRVHSSRARGGCASHRAPLLINN